MFDLESSIAQWREQMLAAGIQSPVPLEELESHLREEIEEQIKSGRDATEAFTFAVQKIGRPANLRAEFKRAGGFIGWLGDSKQRRIERALALLWLVYCAGGALNLGPLFLSPFLTPDFKLSSGFLLAALFALIDLRGIVACVRLFRGIQIIQEGRLIWFIALLDSVGGIMAILLGHHTPLVIYFTALGINSLWLLRPWSKLRVTAS
jgi:hypothetical protein